MIWETLSWFISTGNGYLVTGIMSFLVFITFGYFVHNEMDDGEDITIVAMVFAAAWPLGWLLLITFIICIISIVIKDIIVNKFFIPRWEDKIRSKVMNE